MFETLSALLHVTEFRWTDLVDILIVAFLVYELLLLMRGTRAVQMAIGIVFLVTLFYTSRWAGLKTVNWLITNFVGYVVFGLIVLFQAEIRRALAHFGRAPFIRAFATPEGAIEVIDEIVLATSTLASKRIGAIIVIERDIGLRNYVEGGITLDAALTYDLLVSVFQPGTPLHDGAVIIQKDRLAAAACFLPLTVNPQLSKELGTRHRAAIGVTEETDAVAIVVSEETGAVSVVVGGTIRRRLSPEGLRDALLELLLQRQPGAVEERARHYLEL